MLPLSPKGKRIDMFETMCLCDMKNALIRERLVWKLSVVVKEVERNVLNGLGMQKECRAKKKYEW